MSRSKPLHISIPKPCTESWDLMTKESNGRFCSNCQKTVIDFSHLSNAELYNYFKTLKTIPCGRFHNSQLNTPIVAANHKKNFWINFYRPVAAALAFLSIKNYAAANIKKEIPTTYSPSWKNPSVSNTPEEKLIINGTVKDFKRQPIENAEIRVGEIIVAKSDKDGNYQFELKENQTTSLIIIISYPELVTAVRNYHPAMLSTTFDVILYVPSSGEGFVTMGIPFITVDNLPVKGVCFKDNNKTLSDDAKAGLSTLVIFMRNNPGFVLQIVGYPPLIKLNKLRQDMVKNYLVDHEGLAEDRLIFKMETKSKKGMANTLEIMPAEK